MSKNEILYQALNVLTDELIDRGWCDMNIQQLELDEISILKAIEFALPKNVFLTIDYNIDEDDDSEEVILKPDSELSDYMHEEEAVIKENGADQKEYSYLFGKCFMKDDGTKAVRIIEECHRKDEDHLIESICQSNDPMPFIYEQVELFYHSNDEYEEGWNFGEGFAYKALFNEKNLPGVDVNVPVECGDYFRLDADGQLWTENEELQEWHIWEEISPKKYDKLHAEAEANLLKVIERKAEKEEKQKTRRSRKNKNNDNNNDGDGKRK